MTPISDIITTVLYCTVLYCTVLYCTIFNYVFLFLFCLVAVVSRCFLPVIYRRGVRYSRCPSLWLLIDCCTPFPPPSFYSAVWRTRCPCPCFVFLSGLSCTTYICIWLPFLPYAYYMWLPWFVSFLFLGFPPPESLPGDDVLCRLLPRPLPSVCFLFFFPTVLVPDLF